MSLYNLLKYTQSYSMTSRSLWTYCRDKIDDADHNHLNIRQLCKDIFFYKSTIWFFRSSLSHNINYL